MPEGNLVPEPAITEILARWREGDQDALRRLIPLLYNDLRRLAHQYVRKARPDHTLQAAALVHEAYLRLKEQHSAHFQNGAHFIAICALLMRQILSSYERTRRAAKRGRGEENLTLDDALDSLA